MKIKSLMFILLSAFVIVTMNSCRNKENKQIKKNGEVIEYTCSMHPQIIRYEPGNCPICSMKLVLKNQKSSNDKNTKLQDVLNHTYNTYVGTMETVSIKNIDLPLVIEATGVIEFDQRRVFNIAAKVGGRIEKLYFKYAWDKISKGDKILEIYSPELQTEQENFLFLNKQSLDAELTNFSKQKLLLLGMTEQQILNMAKNSKINPYITIYAQQSGYISEVSKSSTFGKNKSSGSPMSSMNSMNSVSKNNATTSKTNNNLQIKEGQYVNTGDVLFQLVNADEVWASISKSFDIPAKDLNNAKVDIITENNEVISSRINFIEPVIRDGQKSTNIRVYLNNRDYKLRIGQFVNSKIYAGSKTADWLAISSVLDLGVRKIVYLKDKKVFRAKEVQTGIIIGDKIELISGLNQNDKIVKNVQILVDSEDFIKPENDESN